CWKSMISGLSQRKAWRRFATSPRPLSWIPGTLRHTYSVQDAITCTEQGWFLSRSSLSRSVAAAAEKGRSAAIGSSFPCMESSHVLASCRSLGRYHRDPLAGGVAGAARCSGRAEGNCRPSRLPTTLQGRSQGGADLQGGGGQGQPAGMGPGSASG